MSSPHADARPYPDDGVDGPRGRALWERADRVLPGGGIYFARSADFAGRGTLPGFIESGRGAMVYDVDGKPYVDFLCANGPVLLGYAHPEVDEAARLQAETGRSASLYPPVLIEFCEFMVDRSPDFDWAVAAKNGSDVVGLAARVARATTGRNKIIQFAKAYHGFTPEFALGNRGVPESHQSEIVWVPYNDAEALLGAVNAHEDDLAAIIVNPLDQNPGVDTVGASDDFVAAIGDAQRRTDVRVIVDDVRHGFRLDPLGSHRVMGLEPDLVGFGKALGNGHAIGVLMGTDEMRRGARRILFTATFCFEMVALRAAITTVEVYDRDDALATITRAGRRLEAGIKAAASSAGHEISWSGPPTMPSLRFVDDPDQTRGRAFSTEAARRGAIFHPSLNWFLNSAHDDATIDNAITAAAEAFATIE